MSNLDDANDALASLMLNGSEPDIVWAYKFLNSRPVEDIVHCKDCIYHGGYTRKFSYVEQYCKAFGNIATDNFFCAYGRRRDD